MILNLKGTSWYYDTKHVTGTKAFTALRMIDERLNVDMWIECDANTGITYRFILSCGRPDITFWVVDGFGGVINRRRPIALQEGLSQLNKEELKIYLKNYI